MSVEEDDFPHLAPIVRVRARPASQITIERKTVPAVEVPYDTQWAPKFVTEWLCSQEGATKRWRAWCSTLLPAACPIIGGKRTFRIRALVSAKDPN
jgi:hypothetical protein